MKPNQILIYPKIFLYPSGATASEVFLFADIIWNSCTKNSNVNCPYKLDGIILTPLEQKYSRERKEQRFPIYKYKPPHTNSLDVYITFERNLIGQILSIFEKNSLKIHSIKKIKLSKKMAEDFYFVHKNFSLCHAYTIYLHCFSSFSQLFSHRRKKTMIFHLHRLLMLRLFTLEIGLSTSYARWLTMSLCHCVRDLWMRWSLAS